MFTGISWATYGIIVSVALIAYYLFIGFKYYFAGAEVIPTRKSRIQNQAPGEISEEPIAIPATDHDDRLMRELAGKLASVIDVASANNHSAQELKQSLRPVLNEYSSVKNSPVRSSINQMIVAECNKNASITLREDEVEQLWDGKA